MNQKLIADIKRSAGQELIASLLPGANLSMPLPDPDPILRQALQGRSTYKDIVADTRVASLLESRQGGLLARTPTLQDTNCKPEVKTACEELLATLKIYEIITDIWDAIPFGMVPVEICWDVVDGRLFPVSIKGINQSLFWFNQRGELIFRSFGSAEINCTVDHPLQIIPVRRKPTARNPWGEPLASRLFWPVAFKRGGLEFWLEFTEKYGSPFVVAKYRQGADRTEQDSIIAACDMLRRGGQAAYPEGTSIEILEAAGKGASAELYEKLVRWSTEEMSVAILGHVGSSNATAGKLGDDTTAQDIREQLIDSDCRVISTFFDELLRIFVQLNFGDTPAPQLVFIEENGVLKEVADRDKVLSELGVQFKPSYITRTFGIDENDFTMADNSVQKTPALSLNSSGVCKTPLQYASMYGRSANAPDSSDPIQQLTDQALSFGSPMDSMIADIEQMVENATSLDALRTDILSAYAKLDAGALTEILSQAFTIATLQGMADAQ